ncbi:hypothetical protein [Roseococcus sp. YIM B11640]|uniref:hypothetical protein n=1 Tax=Roseococcus sp. YIM B11640 TaxID=3133973 RepID=UPI003C7AB6C5
MPEPVIAPPPLEPALWRDFTGTRRDEAQMAQARDGCILEGNRWADDRAARTLTQQAYMSGWAPRMEAAIAQGRVQHILNCMRTAGWEPA